MIKALHKLSGPLLVLAACSGIIGPTISQAAYPDKPITIILPFGAGGAGDKMMRIITPKVQEALGQTIVLKTQAGAGTNIGTQLVARSKPDGYTLLVTGIPLTVNPFLYKELAWKVSDFAPISLLSISPYFVVVNSDMPVKTLAELIQYVKAHPKEINFASAGAGSGAHLAGALFNQKAGTQMVHIPYKGGPQGMVDVVGGRAQVTFSTLIASAALIASGRIRALATTGSQRSPSFPDLPAVAKSVPGYEVLSWYGLVAPAGTPDGILEKLNRAFNKALKDPQIVDLLREDDMELTPRSRIDFGRFIKSNTKIAESLVTSFDTKME